MNNRDKETLPQGSVLVYAIAMNYVIAGGLLVFQVTVLYIMGQPWICQCGSVQLWAGDIFSSDNSQHITDWYTFSHLLHGLLLYALLSWLFPKLSFVHKLLIALAAEISWELVENTPAVINHYRESALAAGYVGDSIINSISDTVAMVIGFFAAKRMNFLMGLAVFLVFEITTAYMVRDNLTLNVINLVYPTEQISNWQLEQK